MVISLIYLVIIVVILCFKMEEMDVKSIIRRIEAEVAKTRYSASVGYAVRKQAESIHNLEKRANRSMYEAKRGYYQTKGVDRRRR